MRFRMRALLLFAVGAALAGGVGRLAAQQTTVTGRITNEQGAPIAGAQILVKGTAHGTLSSNTGNYSISATPGQVLQFSYLGMTTVERTVGSAPVINVQMQTAAIGLQAVVVTALGQEASKRSLGTAQQTVTGNAVAATQRENFVDALQGRIAGVNVTSTSGLPGASSSITIRGVSSISSSNQPLFVIDGLPVNNKTMNTAYLASDVSSNTALSNRGIDFTNRAADFNSEDIASITVLKGPEAAALYGIDAANGAIVITTKRGRPGQSGFDYSADFKVEGTRSRPEIQQVYGPQADPGSSTFLYFGAPYPAGTKFYDNIDGFFRTALTQHHNLAFSGATTDGRMNYRISAGMVRQNGVIPNSSYDRINVTAATQAQALNWLNVDASLQYANDVNDVPLTANGGPLLGLLVWPSTDNVKDWLTPSGMRRMLTGLGYSEMDNPYFNINKNHNDSHNNRMVVNVGLKAMPFSWGYLKTNIGVDGYTNQVEVLRNPESSLGYNYKGVLDQTTDVNRDITAQTLLNINPHQLTRDFSISGFVGNEIRDEHDAYDILGGNYFMDPNFVSINNSLPEGRTRSTSIVRRRLVSAFGQAQLNFRDYLYLTGTGRNDWTSTIPTNANSFFYPSVSGSFVFTDAFPALQSIFSSGKLRAAYAEVGRDAAPYSYAPSLEYKTTSYAGYGAGFWGPNPDLKPEFAKSYEFGTELSFLNDRLGVDATVYRKRTYDQIVQNIRGSYATGFILFNLNGASTQNQGLELTLRGTPLMSKLQWDVLVNFTAERGKVLSLPHELPESYMSDTWLYGNVRNGVTPGKSTMSLTGTFWLRVDSAQGGHKGELLIDPSTGLPIRSSTWIDRGYDRQPDFTIGIDNTFTYRRFSLDFLVDIRKGGDIFDATDHYLTTRGLAMSTLDRNRPRVIQGVLRDGNENTDHPTINNIVITPAVRTAYYTNMSEEMFIEKNINWLRLRDVTLRYQVPGKYVGAKTASVFLTVTDPLLITNYTGLDPIVNGNTAAVGGSSGVGIDYGNFPIPRGINFGFRVGF